MSGFVLMAWCAAALGGIEDFKVTTEHTVDASSLESIVKDAFRLSGAKTNDEKAIAIYEYLHQAIFHRACPVENKPQTVGPLKVLNVYGWGLCGSQHTVLKALYETAGWKCRYLGWPGHSTIEVFYDGRWHYLDVFLKCYYWSKDKTHVASQEEIANDPSIVMDAVKEGRAAPQNLCCGDAPEDVVKGCQARKDYGDSKGWANVTWRDEDYSPRLNLPVGASLELGWEGAPNGYVVNMPAGGAVHTCGFKDFVNDHKLGPIFEHYGPRSWSNGWFEYAPEFARVADRQDIVLENAHLDGGRLVADRADGRAIFKIKLPYVMESASVAFEYDGAGKLSVSDDRGRTWKTVQLADFSKVVRQKYEIWMRTEFTRELRRFRFTATIEHNRGVLPYLVNGTNRITVTTNGPMPEGTVGVVRFSYLEATVQKPNAERPFNGHGLLYSRIKTVAKEFSNSPFSFDLDVGGNTPPKMITFERSVRSR